MRPHNPVRRSRKIGTADQGWRKQNSLVIPERWGEKFWETIGRHELQKRNIGSKSVTFIVSETRSGWVHPCSIDDISKMLGLLPESDWAGLGIIVFRQPSKKQSILSPVWGRMVYQADFQTSQGQKLVSGPSIILEAINPDRVIKWSTSLDPEKAGELERLRADGHSIHRNGRMYEIGVSTSAARNTQLYRTIPHEVGHWFDWLSKVEEPTARGGDFIELSDAYFARLQAEREAFAHRYADEHALRLSEMGAIPFPPTSKPPSPSSPNSRSAR